MTTKAVERRAVHGSGKAYWRRLGAQLSPIISDAAVQYIAGIIDEDGLRAAWADWAAQGGDAMTAEYNEAYHAAQK